MEKEFLQHSSSKSFQLDENINIVFWRGKPLGIKTCFHSPFISPPIKTEKNPGNTPKRSKASRVLYVSLPRNTYLTLLWGRRATGSRVLTCGLWRSWFCLSAYSDNPLSRFVSLTFFVATYFLSLSILHFLPLVSPTIFPLHLLSSQTFFSLVQSHPSLNKRLSPLFLLFCMPLFFAVVKKIILF